MKLFSKIFKKRERAKVEEDITVVIKTNKELTEEQENIIKRIVKDGVNENVSLNCIGMSIILEAGVYTPVIIQKVTNGIEVII